MSFPLEPSWRLTWISWVPLRIKIFLWLAYHGRCWTADRLARRGLAHSPLCLLCDQEPETMEQLLVGCSFSHQVWHEVLAWCRITTTTLPRQGLEFREWLSLTVRDAPTAMHRGLASPPSSSSPIGELGSTGMPAFSTATDHRSLFSRMASKRTPEPGLAPEQRGSEPFSTRLSDSYLGPRTPCSPRSCNSHSRRLLCPCL